MVDLQILKVQTMWVMELFLFFSTPKDELSRAFQSQPNIHFLTFSLKNGQNFAPKYEIQRCSREAILAEIFLVCEYTLKIL